MHGVETAFVLVETLQPDLIPEDLQEFLEEQRVIVVVEYLLLAVLTLLDINHPHLQLRLDKNLIELQKLFGRVWQLAQGQRRIDVHLLAEATYNFFPIVSARNPSYLACPPKGKEKMLIATCIASINNLTH